jgi:hypothetical protein
MGDEMKPRNIKLVCHRSPESVVAEHWKMPIAELSAAQLGGIDAEGKQLEYSVDDMIEGIRAQGLWGFADTRNLLLHYWKSVGTSDFDLMHFLAHELYHLRLKPHRNHLRDEKLAEDFGRVAAEAFRLLKAVKK